MLNFILDMHAKEKKFPPFKELFDRLAGGQNPEALLITCSDSRIVPEIILNSEPGKYFPKRDAGNLVAEYDKQNPTQDAGTLEFALEQLNIQHAIIMGHTKCGAMTGILYPESLKRKLPATAAMLDKYAHEVQEKSAHEWQDYPEEEKLKLISEYNVLVQIKHLETHPCVQEKLAQGKLKIHGWMYDLDTREISIYDPRTESFVSTQIWLDTTLKPFFTDMVCQIFSPHTKLGFCKLLELFHLSERSNNVEIIWGQINEAVTHAIQKQFGSFSAEKLDGLLCEWLREQLPDCKKALYESEGYRLFCNSQLRQYRPFFSIPIEEPRRVESCSPEL